MTNSEQTSFASLDHADIDDENQLAPSGNLHIFLLPGPSQLTLRGWAFREPTLALARPLSHTYV